MPSAYTPRGANSNPPTAQAQIAVTASQQPLTIPGAPFVSDTPARFMVDGTVPITWCYGNEAGLTVNNGVPMVANSVELFSIPSNVTQISVIAAGTGSTLRIVVGDGV